MISCLLCTLLDEMWFRNIQGKQDFSLPAKITNNWSFDTILPVLFQICSPLLRVQCKYYITAIFPGYWRNTVWPCNETDVFTVSQCRSEEISALEIRFPGRNRNDDCRARVSWSQKAASAPARSNTMWRRLFTSAQFSSDSRGHYSSAASDSEDYSL